MREVFGMYEEDEDRRVARHPDESRDPGKYDTSKRTSIGGMMRLFR